MRSKRTNGQESPRSASNQAHVKKKLLVPAVCVALAAGTTVAMAASPGRLSYDVVKAGPQDGGGEPSMAIGPDGRIYVSYPGGHINMLSSTDGGRSWTKAASPASDNRSSGDTSVNVDPSGAVYETTLNAVRRDTSTLQVDLWKSTDHGQTWPVHGAAALDGSNSTGQPLLVDRQWTDAAIPPGATTDKSIVSMEYHDWGPDTVWVTTSTDGGRTFNQPVNIINDPAAIAASFCDTIPGGLKIVPYDKHQQHPGRIYAAWLAADPANPATGCNETQMAAFHSVWIAYSDDRGATWTDKPVYDAGPLHDGSEIFADLTLDDVGNPYIAFTMNVEKQFDVWATDSFDGGNTWIKPVRVNQPSSKTQTHYFPAIAAGKPGEVLVAYLASPGFVPTAPTGKPQPVADADFDWFVYSGMTRNLNAATPVFATTQITPTSMHHGDICTLGIFCSAVPGADRDILDFIDVQVDRGGMGHVAFTGDYDKYQGIYVANQTDGPSVGRPGH